MRLVSQTHKSHTHTHPYAQAFTYDGHVTDHDAAVKYNHDGIAYSACMEFYLSSAARTNQRLASSIAVNYRSSPFPERTDAREE
jgi:hypothetical protein